MKHHFYKLSPPHYHRQNEVDHMFRNQERDSGLECPLTVYICGLLCVHPIVYMHMLLYVLDIFLSVLMCIPIEYPYYRLASLLGLALKVAQANTRQVAKPLPH